MVGVKRMSSTHRVGTMPRAASLYRQAIALDVVTRQRGGSFFSNRY